MIHNPQQLEKALIALKIINIIVLKCVLYCVSPFHWWLYYLKLSLHFKYSLHTYNIKKLNYYVEQF